MRNSSCRRSQSVIRQCSSTCQPMPDWNSVRRNLGDPFCERDESIRASLCEISPIDPSNVYHSYTGDFVKVSKPPCGTKRAAYVPLAQSPMVEQSRMMTTRITWMSRELVQAARTLMRLLLADQAIAISSCRRRDIPLPLLPAFCTRHVGADGGTTMYLKARHRA